MKPDLDHLSRQTQRELAHVVRVLLEEFGEQTARAVQGWAKRGRIIKVVLCAPQLPGEQRDGYEDAQVPYRILVVVNDTRLTDSAAYWATAAERLLRDATVNKALSARVRFVVRGLSEISGGSGWRPPVADAEARGIVLYEVGGFALAARLAPLRADGTR
jgi:hypothetical protein